MGSAHLCEKEMCGFFILDFPKWFCMIKTIIVSLKSIRNEFKHSSLAGPLS